jgi:hypothetical protein
VATADTDELLESSGIVASRVNPDLYWTHNDSGDGPRLWALRLTEADRGRRVARVVARVHLTGASSRDWEDVAWGPGGTIYVLDGGDNPPCERSDKRIHRFVEPKIEFCGPVTDRRPAFESMRFEYPDLLAPDRPARRNEHRYDAECLLVHPTDGDVYIVTKRDNAQRHAARVYHFPGRQIRWDVPAALHVLEFLADISAKVRRVPGPLEIANMITGGDVDRHGERVVLRDYVSALEFRLPAGEPFERIFQQAPAAFSLFGEPVGEGICYSLDGREFITTSEAKEFGLKHCPIFATPCTMPPGARAGP